MFGVVCSNNSYAAIDATPMLVEAAAAVVEQRSKHEELDVAAHAITANSAQLVSNSRQKVLPSGAESRDGLIAAGVRIMNATTVLRWHSPLVLCSHVPMLLHYSSSMPHVFRSHSSLLILIPANLFPRAGRLWWQQRVIRTI